MTKKVLLFWSGGADSTYLLLQDLRAGYEVHVVYVSILNNKLKTKRELAAIKALKQDIKKFCNFFKIALPYYEENASINIPFVYMAPNAAQEIIFISCAILLGQGFDEIHRGIVLGDSSRDCTLAKEWLDCYNNTVDTTPNIVKPLVDVSKESIYLTLKGYDDSLNTNFINHITCCENNEVDDNCGLCIPCNTKIQVYKNLGWSVSYSQNSQEKESKETENIEEIKEQNFLF